MRTIIIKTFRVIMVVTAVSGAICAQTDDDPARKQYAVLSSTNENHKLLAALNGEWAFTGRHTSPGPSGRTIEFKGTAIRRPLWEDRYFIMETTGEKTKMPWSQGKLVTYHDMYLEGYDNVKKKFFSTSIGNESITGMVTMEGTYDPALKILTYEGESISHFHTDTPPGTKFQFRVLIRIIDNDHFILEQHESIDSKEIVMTELKYTRVK